jgi:hypothetical protein
VTSFETLIVENENYVLSERPVNRSAPGGGRRIAIARIGNLTVRQMNVKRASREC